PKALLASRPRSNPHNFLKRRNSTQASPLGPPGLAQGPQPRYAADGKGRPAADGHVRAGDPSAVRRGWEWVMAGRDGVWSATRKANGHLSAAGRGGCE